MGGQPHPKRVLIYGELVEGWHAWQCTHPVHDCLNSCRHGFNGLVDIDIPGLHVSGNQSRQGKLLSQTLSLVLALQQNDAYLAAAGLSFDVLARSRAQYLPFIRMTLIWQQDSGLIQQEAA